MVAAVSSIYQQAFKASTPDFRCPNCPPRSVERSGESLQVQRLRAQLKIANRKLQELDAELEA